MTDVTGRVRRASLLQPGIAGQIALGLGTATLATALAALLRALTPGPSSFLFVYIPPIAAVAYAGGRLAGVVAAIVSAAVAFYTLLSPLWSFRTEPDPVPVAAVFAVVALGSAVGASRMREVEHDRRALASAERRSADLLRLERGVASSVVASMQDGLLLRGPDGTLVDASPSLCRMTGFAREELIGLKAPLPFWPPEHRPAIEAAFSQYMAGESAEYDLIFARRNGERFPVLVTTAVARDGAGCVTGYVAAVKDVTDRKRDEQALRESEERYRGLVELSPDAILIHVDGSIVFANAAAAALLGAAAPEDLIGLSYLDVVHPAWRSVAEQRLRRMREAREAVPRIEEQYVRRDGSPVDVETASAPFAYRGRPAIQAVARDVSGRRRGEQERARLLVRERAARAEAEAAQRRLGSIVEASPVGIAFLDRAQRFVAINDALAEIDGLSREAHLGRTVEEVFSQSDPRLVQIFRGLYAAGEPFVSPDLPVNVPGRDDRRPGYYDVHYLPVRDEAGAVEGVLAYVIDVTERVRLEDAQRQLQQALAQEQAILSEVIARAPAGIALLWGPEHRFRLANEHYLEMVPGSRAILGRTIAEVFPDAAHQFAALLDRVFTTGEPFRGDEMPFRMDDPRAFEGFRYFTFTYTPVPGPDAGVGGVLAVVVEATEQVRRRRHLERELATERAIAETLQRSLLPERLPEIPGVAVAARYLPAGIASEVGGDWYDVIPLPDGRVGLAMGDVAGRGVPAAAVMGQARNALRAYAADGHGPAAVVERLNRLVFGQMVTLLYLVFDPRTWMVTYASAGHLPPLIVLPDGRTAFLEGGRSVPLGVVVDPVYREAVETVERGSTVLLYTDGLVEARGAPLDEGLERLRCAAGRGTHADVDEVLDRVLAEVLGGEAGADDVAVLALHAAPVLGERLRLRLAADPSSLLALRHALSRWLAEAGAGDDEAYEITVAAGEAATNAVEHAYGPGDAVFEAEAVRAGSAVEITVRDFGQWRAPRGKHRGRGLGLMEALMDTAEVRRSQEGTTVVLRRRLREAVPV